MSILTKQSNKPYHIHLWYFCTHTVHFFLLNLNKSHIYTHLLSTVRLTILLKIIHNWIHLERPD